MKDLDFKTEISGGFYQALKIGILGALGFALGEDFAVVWNEGWNDPYGRD